VVAMSTGYSAIVQNVFPNGNHGPYALATSDSIGFITFLLAPPVWSENSNPEPGTYVVLSDLTKKRAGWRAGSARFFRPADEQERKEK
jgi:hypothetical protein